MNKLVIIGNGFDLAHGLPTSYKDFVNDFWKNLSSCAQNQIYREVVEVNLDLDLLPKTSNFQEFKDYIRKFPKNSEYFGYSEFPLTIHKNNHTHTVCSFKFKNAFFEIICNRSIKNWVDIEKLYYEEIKNIFDRRKKHKHSEMSILETDQDVRKLNQEFEQVKNLLEHYLSQKVKNNYEWNGVQINNEDYKSIITSLTPISIFNNEHNILKEFTKQEDRDKIEIIFENQKNGDYQKYRVSTCLLNFNYTPTLLKYFNKIKKEDDYYDISIIHIHGELESQLNRVNFGFGDELDKEYKEIENLDDNEFLRFFKSFQYRQNDNYEKTLNYIDNEPFQVCIMGHSCGLSDRTLLNTIFEHKNCRSIKVFYYEYEEDGIKKDNYTEIVQNISRHFDDKKAMREKIVNKTLCKPLPQNVRFNEKKH